MSRIFKSYNVIVDENNRVNIQTNKIKFNLENNKDIYSKENKEEKTNNILEINKKREEIKLKILKMEEEAKEKANKILEEANIEAEKIKKDIEKNTIEEIEEIKNKAQKEGYEKGINLAKEEAEQIRNDAIIYRENLKNSLEEEIVELIDSIVEKILFNEVDINPQLISILVKNTLYKTNNLENIKVKVSVENYDELEKLKNNILKDINNIRNLDIIKDSTLQKYDCIIETSFGIINCGIDSQYKELKRSLYNILKTSN